MFLNAFWTFICFLNKKCFSKKTLDLSNDSTFIIYLFKLFIFGWEIIAHNIVLASVVYQQELAIGMRMPLPLEPPTSHPSRLSQSSWFELPASYNKFPLAVIMPLRYCDTCHECKNGGTMVWKDIFVLWAGITWG